jgi:hypothetical protein
MATHDRVTIGPSRQDDTTEAQKLGVDVADVVANRISEEDLMKHSAESLTLKSRTGFRLLLVMLVMGANQAG